MPSLILLHTTEHPWNGTFEGVDNYLRAMGYEPNEMFSPRDLKLVNYIPAGQSSKALFNATGGVETNRREADGSPGADVYQIEIFYRAGEEVDAQWYANLRAHLQQLCRDFNIPYVFPLPHAVDYGMAQRLLADGGTRLTFPEWSDPHLVGIVFHANAPENVHWDPTFDPTPLIDLNSGGVIVVGAPQGKVDVTEKTPEGLIRIAGWAFDPDEPNASLTIHIYLEGVLVTGIIANGPRPDVNAAYGISGDHGYDLLVKPVIKQHVTVYALDRNDPSDNVMLGQADVIVQR